MGTISARKIEASLSKARDIGYVEEPFTLGDSSFVMRNLRPEQYKRIFEENEELEGVDHVYSFQQSHIARSLCEINGTDLRKVDFVEVEEEVFDPKTKQPQVDANGNPVFKTVKLELHDYLRKHVIAGWSKEATLVAWRKFTDVLSLAETKAKEGVKFVLPEETPEETFRRAIAMVREAMTGVPEAIVESVLEEAGLMRISTAEELRKAMAITDQLAREQAEPEPQAAPPQAQSPTASEASIPGPVVPPPTAHPGVRRATVQEIMAARTPLNQEAATPLPNHQEPVVATRPQVQPPPQVGGEAVLRASQRAAKIAKMEGESPDIEVPLPPPGDPTMAFRHVPVQGNLTTGQPPGHATTQPNAPHLVTAKPPSGEKPLLSQPGRERVNLEEFNKIREQPPRGGINPRFRPAR